MYIELVLQLNTIKEIPIGEIHSVVLENKFLAILDELKMLFNWLN